MEKSYISTLTDLYIEKAHELGRELETQIVEEKEGNKYLTTFGCLLAFGLCLSYVTHLFRR